MEIWTNGTITPDMALVEAAKILRKHLNAFVQHFELGDNLDAEASRAAQQLHPAGNRRIDRRPRPGRCIPHR